MPITSKRRYEATYTNQTIQWSVFKFVPCFGLNYAKRPHCALFLVTPSVPPLLADSESEESDCESDCESEYEETSETESHGNYLDSNGV